VRGFAGRVAAVTGAGSGIGRALAEELARRGAHLALADVDEEALAEVAGSCAGEGVKVTTCRLDVAQRSAVEAWAASVVEEHGRVDLVVNNAGVALLAEVAAMDLDDLEWLVGVNFFGVVHGTKAFLPRLIERGEGHIVNVSSVFGLLAVPTQSAYCAAKFAVRGFTEALRTELEIARCGVSCTTVFPGGVRTNIARRARVEESIAAAAGGRQGVAERFERICLTRPPAAARRILAAVEHDRARLLIGPDARFIDLLSRLPAGLHRRVLVAGGRLGRRRAG
jgi:short-subunit dehydrogenase